MPRALITGITGQDGSYLAEFLLDEGLRGLRHGPPRLAPRRSSASSTSATGSSFVQADLLDQSSLIHALEESEPDEVYNLAAQSFVPTSWRQPVLTGGVHRARA